jgi:hypothetical protein
MPTRWTPEERALREMSESELASRMYKMARAGRWLLYHVPKSGGGRTHGDAGFPDWVLCRPPRLLLVELKRETEKPWPDQERWLRALASTGAEVFIWRPSLIAEMQEALV